MTTEAYLSQIKNIDNRIKDKQEESLKWHDIAIGRGAGLSEDKVQTSMNYDKMGDAATLAVFYEQESKEIAYQLTQLKHRIIEQIDSIKDEILYNILVGYYIYDRTMSDVACDLRYSYKQTKRYHKKALELFEEVYGSEYLEIMS